MKEDHQQAIEEKDAATALLNYDLDDRKRDNVTLQAQRDVYKDQLQKCQDIIIHLKTRHVLHSKDPGKDNIVMIIEKKYCPRGRWVLWVSLLYCKNTTTVYYHKKTMV